MFFLFRGRMSPTASPSLDLPPPREWYNRRRRSLSKNQGDKGKGVAVRGNIGELRRWIEHPPTAKTIVDELRTRIDTRTALKQY